jgi:choline-glycine betaine transporter
MGFLVLLGAVIFTIVCAKFFFLGAFLILWPEGRTVKSVVVGLVLVTGILWLWWIVLGSKIHFSFG